MRRHGGCGMGAEAGERSRGRAPSARRLRCAPVAPEKTVNKYLRWFDHDSNDTWVRLLFESSPPEAPLRTRSRLRPLFLLFQSK